MLTPDLPSSSGRFSSKIGFLQNVFLLGLVCAVFMATASVTATDNEPRRLKIAFEIHSSSSFDAFVTNVEGLQTNFGEMAEITVVASFDGVSLLRASDNSLESRLAKLADRGVDFIVCDEGLKHEGMAGSDLLGFARTVPSGNKQIERLKKQGWARVADGESYVIHL